MGSVDPPESEATAPPRADRRVSSGQAQGGSEIHVSLPTGTVTFLFTDIEGSTRLLQSLGDAYPELLEAHHALIRGAIDRHEGVEVRTEGDAFFAVFPAAIDAVEAAATAQRAMASYEGPAGALLRVRMGVHTGAGTLSGGDYVGLDVHRAARISAVAHGGQVLASQETAILVERALPEWISLRDLGKHRLKDLHEAEALFQLVIDGLDADFPPLRSLEAVRHNLPFQVTSFVGRERELTDGLRLLAGTHVLTLTGPGGTGKTRLALQVAAEAAADFAHGAFFVDLAAITDPEMVPSVILETLGVPASNKDRSPADILSSALMDKNVLLVLDNFEQLLDAAPLVARLVQAAPRTKFLITSRAPLHIAAEQEMAVPPLPTARPDQADLDVLGESEAIRLFVERAATVLPDFALTADNAAAVAELVDHLDGLPLAIELAASRIKLLTPQAMLDRLDAHLLAGAAPDLPERQQTLSNAIGWSYDLLDEPARRLLTHLSVFAGDARLEEIETVCGSSDLGIDLLDGLAALVDHSLLHRGGDGKPRFRMLRVIRQFAAGRLEASGEGARVRDRHAEVYAAFAERAAQELLGHERSRWLDTLAGDHDNLRAALRWSLEQGDDDRARRIGFACWRFWQARGHLHQARRWLEKALAGPGGDPFWRAKALEAQGGVAWWQGDMELCVAAYREAYRIHEELGDRREVANALYNLGLTTGFGIGRRQEGLDMLERAQRLYEEVGNQSGLGDVYWGRANIVAFSVGQMEEARELVLTAIEHYRTAGNHFGFGWANYEYGDMSRRLGDYDAAWSHLLDGLELLRKDGDVSGAVIFLNSLAALAGEIGDRERAVRIAGIVHGLRLATGTDLVTLEVNAVPGLDFETLEALTGDLAEAYREGRAMDLDQAVAYAREGCPLPLRSPPG